MKEQAHTSPTQGSAETVAANLELIRHLYTCPSDEKEKAFAKAIALDATIRQAETIPFFGGTFRGLPAAERMYAKWRRVIDPDMKLLALCGGDEYVMGLCEIHTTDEQPYQTQVVECWRIIDGKIVDLAVFYWDTQILGREIQNRFFHGRVPFQPYLC